MQYKPTHWDELLSGSHKTQYRFVIAGVEYTEKDLWTTPTFTKPLMATPGIGNCCSASLALTVIKKDGITIPKAADVYAYARLTNGTVTTDWVDQGHFKVSKRLGEKNRLQLTCWDLMGMMNRNFISATNISHLPASMTDVVADISSVTGIPLDSRTTIQTGEDFKIFALNAAETMLDILSIVAVAHAGNWIITEAGKLRLVPIAGTAAEAVQRAVSYKRYTENITNQSITAFVVSSTETGVSTVVSNADPGLQIPASLPELKTGVSTYLQSVLDGGLPVHPYTLSGAFIDPCVELGDTIAIQHNGATKNLLVTSMVVRGNVAYDADLSYSLDLESVTEDEYPYVTAQNSTTNQVQARLHGLKITEDQIILSVATKVGEDEIISKINLSSEGIQISASKINLTGYVTVTDLSTAGSTTINGANITTGTISAARVDLSDYITVTDLSTSGSTVINGDNITTGTISAARLELSGYVRVTDLSTSGSTTINGDNITTGTISASRLDLSGYATFTDLSTAGSTNINGANITTGTIDAARLNLTGVAMFTDVTAAQAAAEANAASDATSKANAAIAAAAADATNKANAAQAAAESYADDAVAAEQLVYISKASGTNSVAAPSSWVTDTTGSENTWTTKRPVYSPSYPVLFVATQRKTLGNVVSCTTPVKDETTTVIDGGHITTGTIDASRVTVTNISASNISTGTMSASRISGGTLILGGANNTNGLFILKNANGTEVARGDRNGFTSQSLTATNYVYINGGAGSYFNIPLNQNYPTKEYMRLSSDPDAPFIVKTGTGVGTAQEVIDIFRIRQSELYLGDENESGYVVVTTDPSIYVGYDEELPGACYVDIRPEGIDIGGLDIDDPALTIGETSLSENQLKKLLRKI